ncbi:MAG: baeRF3 domain-containing protein [Anaerolineae bacterium]
MDVLSREELGTLLGKPGGPCISIFMPTFRTGAEVQQNPIRLKNLLQRAEELLVNSGMRTPEARGLLAPAAELLDDAMFWRQLEDGLAMFVATDAFHSYRLPISFEEQVILNERFQIKPLLPLFSDDRRFYILALSQNEVRLLEGTRYTVSEVDLEGVPESLSEVLKYDVFGKTLQAHARAPQRGGPSGVAMFGYTSLKDVAKSDILRYFQRIDRGLHDLLKDERTPLVLAGVDYLLPIYKEANTYNYLMKEGIEGNPEVFNAQTLHKQAWAIVQPHFQKAQEEALAQYNALVGTGRASADPREIVPASWAGRVDFLIVAAGAEVWGRFDRDNHAVELHQPAQPGDEDLAGLAVVQTILNRGSVYTLEPERMPAGVLLAARFRY